MEQVLVFDAGSSGTRIHVFNILPALDPERAHVPRIDLEVRGKQTRKVKPGLATFAEHSDLDGAQKNIQELLEFANQFVPASRRATTPALLKATAGLRAVKAEQAEAVLQTVRETLQSSGYSFRPEWADIIQGKEEGGLAWVAANYLLGTFDQAAADRPSVGVIEMGGGSTQVTFQVSDDDALASIDNFVFETALGRRYQVYAHSYLGFGQDHAQAQLRARLPATEAEDPCYPKGYERKGAASLIQGAGDWSRCKELIESHLLGGSVDAPGHYAKELPLVGPFVATENFFYVQDKLALKLEDTVVGQAKLEEVAQSACSAKLEPTAEERASMERGAADAGNPNSCFALSYQAALLQTFQIAIRNLEVRIAHKINGGDVDWALGAALVHFLQARAATSRSSAGGLPVTWVPILLVLMLTGLAIRVFLTSSFARQTLAQVTGIKPNKIGAVAGWPAE